MLLGLDEGCLVSALHERTPPAVSQIELLDVLTDQELHPAGKRFRCLDQEMHVVGHVAVGVEPPAAASGGKVDKPVELVVVDGVDEQRLVIGCALRDVKDAIANVYAGRPRHAAKVAAQAVRRQWLLRTRRGLTPAMALADVAG
jgi:hypothetical protein